MTNPEARYRIRADDDSARGWAAALRTADTSGKKIASVMKFAFAGISVGAFTSAISKAIEFGDEVGKAAVKAGVGASEISELGAAVKQLGDVELSSLSTALKFMQVNISKAREDNKKYGETFRALGIDLDSFMKLAPDKQFEEIAEAVSRLRNSEDRARAVTEIFGKAGADLLPAFENGARGIRAAREEAARLGHTMSAEAVKSLQEGDDAIKKLSASWDAFIRSIAVGTVKTAQFFDVIDKDEVGELEDQLEAVNRQLDAAMFPADGSLADQSRVAELEGRAKSLVAQLRIANNEIGRMGAGGPRRGASKTPPGFAKPFVDISATNQRLETMRVFEANIKYLEERDELLQMHLADTIKARQDLEDTLAAGIKEGVGDTLDDTSDSLDQLGERFFGLKDEMSVFADEAARNMQDAFADFLFDPFEDGIRGMAKGFIDTIRRMVAEAAAAKVFETLFKTNSTSSGGNFLTTVLGALFGGGKASGGPLQQGKWYVAGEKGPEPIWGGGPGAYAMGYGGGGAPSVNITTNIDARGASMELTRTLPEILRRNNDEVETRIVQKLRRRQYNLG